MNAMIKWRNLPGEHTELFSQIGLRLLDEISGVAPYGKIRISLDIKDENGEWQKTGIKPLITLSGVITYPGLERRAEVAGQPIRHFRIRLDADLYRPLYPPRTEGYEFEVAPYNDANLPQNIASKVVKNAFLTPATNYPFPVHIFVLYGDVRDAKGVKVADALVTEGAKERVLTDERGAFGLPLRWVQKNSPINITARDRENRRTGMLNVIVPIDLGKNHTIVIS